MTKESEKRRIEAIRKTYKSKSLKHRIALKLKKIYSNVNLRLKMSEKLKKVYSTKKAREKMSRILRINYASHPELRKKISNSMKKVFKEHPNLLKSLQKGLINYYAKNIKYADSFLKGKGNPNPLDYKTLSGKYVRSQYEQAVADVLFVNKIKYLYEAKILLFNKEANFAIPDFYLPKYKIYIEVLGGYPGSQTKARWKRKIYRKHRINCIFLTPSLILELNKNLLNQLPS